MKTQFKIIASALLSGAALLAAAQGFQPRGPAPFEAYDSNQDGVVSPQELTAFRNWRQTECVRAARAKGVQTAPGFESIDSNRDGVISREEMAAHQQQRMNQRPYGKQMPMQPGQGMGMGRNMPSFSEFDLDGNGTLTEDEFIEARGQRIANRAKQGYMMRGLQNMQPFSAIDQNGDGLVDESEFLKMQEQHRQSRIK